MRVIVKPNGAVKTSFPYNSVYPHLGSHFQTQRMQEAMSYSQRKAIETLCQDLGLPRYDRFTQDWEYELAEEFRTVAWLKKYIGAYQNQAYGEQERQVLMKLLLDSLNDGIESGDSAFELLWNDVALLLSRDRELHKQLIEHWSLGTEPLEDAFAITPRIRELRL